jgi:hypothetical protein
MLASLSSNQPLEAHERAEAQNRKPLSRLILAMCGAKVGPAKAGMRQPDTTND